MATTHFSSLNFLSKSAFRKAVADGLPVVLFSPDTKLPAINGPAIVEGPWPRTAAPVEDIEVSRRAARGREGAHLSEDGKRYLKPRQKLNSWRAEVEVRDMRVVAVIH
jgi:hypothetical protein